MKLLKTYLPIILLVILNSCTKDINDYSTEIKFEEFSSVTINNALNVEINYGEAQSVIVLGEEEDVKNILSEVNSDILTLDINSTDKSSLSYKITLPIIREIVNTTNATVEIGNFEQEGNLSIVSKGNGLIELGKFNNVKSLEIEIEGTSTVTGKFPFINLVDLYVKMGDEAIYNAYPIEAKNAIISINGNGSCYLSVKESLTAMINGNGILYYKGIPKIFSNSQNNNQIIKVD